MGLITKSFEHAVVSKALEVFAPRAGSEKLGSGLMALSCFLAIISILMAIYSAFLWLSVRYTPDIAMALTALVTLGFALLIAFFFGLILFFQRYRVRKLQEEVERTLNFTLDLLDEELAETIRENPKIALTLASVTGFVVGDSIR